MDDLERPDEAERVVADLDAEARFFPVVRLDVGRDLSFLGAFAEGLEAEDIVDCDPLAPFSLRVRPPMEKRE